LYYLVPAFEHLSAGRPQAALELYREGLKEFPESILLRHDMAVALIRLDQVEEARESYLAIAAESGLEAQVRLLCLSNLAACNLQLGREDLIGEADRCSAEAMTSMAWHAGVKGTRAAVLVALGRLEEGLGMARDALEHHAEDRGKADIACTLAIGLRNKGDLVEGRKYLDLATQLGCKSRRYRRAVDLYASPVSSQ
jgi:tetratricopeptide (TPR) repeat protein